MSITNELRKYISGPARCGISHICEKNIATIADRIDAEHEKAIRELNNLADAIAVSCVQLPKDANGEYIHIGDRMEHIELGYVLNVIAVGVDCFIAWNTHLNRYWRYDNKLFRHHREPTVEDVLDEFASAYDRIGGEDEEHQKYLDLIAEYAAKLRLANSEEQ